MKLHWRMMLYNRCVQGYIQYMSKPKQKDLPKGLM